MAIRFSVQCDTEAECAASYRLLCDRLNVPAGREPVYTLNSWIARIILDALPDDEPAARLQT